METTWNEFDVFATAVGLESSERTAYLRERCPTEQSYTRMLKLLAESENMPESFLSEPPVLPDSGEHPLYIDQYRIQGVLGKGAMGVVYRAYDPMLKRMVAIKVLAHHLTFNPRSDDFIEDEGQALASLRHPGIVEVYRLGDFSGQQYIAMQFVDGRPFNQWLEEKRAQAGHPTEWSRSDMREILAVLRDMARALEHAHNADLIHCDVKPSNVLIDQHGRAVVIDFGIAQRGAEGETAQQRRGGTAPYMAPECLDVHQSPTRRSDVYSLGVMMYEALSGRSAPESRRRLRSAGEDQVGEPRLAHHCRATRGKVETVCRVAMDPDPDNRYPSAGHMAIDLTACIEGGPLLVSNPAVRRLRTFTRRHSRVLSAVATGVLLLAGAGMIGWTIQERRARLCELAMTTEPSGINVSIRALQLLDGEPGPTVDRVTPFTTRLEPGLYEVIAKAGNQFAETRVCFPSAGKMDSVHLSIPKANDKAIKGMAFVPAGTYELGDPSAITEGHPSVLRQVKIDAFYIDLYEVSNLEYLAFAEANGIPLPPHITAALIRGDTAIADRPVVGISWEQANAYARWMGKRLPTAEEWECAMRYPDFPLVPWGRRTPNDVIRDMTIEQFQKDNLDLADPNKALEPYLRGTVSVSSRDDLASGLGIRHGASNVDEFTSSVDVRTHQMQIKGANWLKVPTLYNLASIQTLPLTSGPRAESTGSFKTGFRCVRSAHP